MSEWEARLERIETIAEVNTQQIQENSQAIRELRASAEEDREQIRENRRQIQELRATVTAVHANAEADREQIRENRRQTQELRAATTALVATCERFQVNFEQIIGEIRDIRNEMRGIRIESQRILRHLFGPEPEPENGDR